MRLDKFLKVSRIIKRRTLAKELCDRGQAMVDGRVAKAGSEVVPGDIVEIRIGERLIKFEILEVKENAPAAEAASLYQVIDKH